MLRLKQAFDLLKYDVFVLSPADMLALESTQTPLSERWLRPADQPRLTTIDVPEGRLAIIIFPDPGHSDQTQEQALFDFARDVRSRGEHNLIIGVSTWGAVREERFISTMEPVFDMVLGSGEGPGYAGLYLRDNKVLWVRTFTKGRNLLTVTIPELPKPGDKTIWTPEATVKTRAMNLDDSVYPAPQIEEIFQP